MTPLSRKMWDPNFPNRPDRFPIFYGWLIALLGTVGMCASMPGQTIGVGVFKTRLMDALALTSIQLSIAYMIGTGLSAIFLNAGGQFFDKFGARKAVVASVAALGFVLLGMSLIDRIAAAAGYVPLLNAIDWLPAFTTLAIGFAFLRYAGQGMLTLSTRAMVGKWFDRKRGAVTAWSGALVSFSFSGAPISFEYLIRQYSWQGAWLIMAVILIVGLLPLCWWLCRDNPEECGLRMDGGEGGAAKKTNPDAVIHRDLSKAEAIRTFAFWSTTLMFAMAGLVITAYTFHILAIGDELGVSSDYILKLFVPGAAVSITSGFLIAWMTDLSFVRVKYLFVLMGGSAAISYACLGLGSYPEIGWLHILCFGLTGGCWSLSSIVYPRFFGREHLGAVSGMFMTTLVVASAIGPFLFSLIHHFTGSYRVGFTLAAFFAVVLSVAAFWADNPQRNLQ